MAKKDKQAERHSSDILENPEALAEQISRSEQFIKDNQTVVFSVIGVMIAVVLGYFTYSYYIDNQNEIAQSELFQAVYYFESDSLDLALNGDGNSLGLLDIAEDYSSTEAGNLSNYYAGVCYLKKGQFVECIDYLEKFGSTDLVIQARAYSLIGDAYMELGNYYDAIDNYNRAVDYRANKFFTPEYLVKAATAYEKVEDYQGALKCYQEIVEKYFESSEIQNAKKHMARLKGMAS